jgi:hypothetical protein
MHQHVDAYEAGEQIALTAWLGQGRLQGQQLSYIEFR